MQALGIVTHADLDVPLQELLYKLEIYDGATWWDLCNLHEALIDGGLEAWSSATNLTSWIEGPTGTSTVNRDAAEVHGGAYSCRLDVDASNSYVSIIQQNIILKLPLGYRISGWYKTEAGKTAEYSLSDSGSNVYLKADGTWTAAVTFVVLPAATSWTHFETFFTPHSAYCEYYAAFLRLSAASSSIWFDDVSIAACPSYYLKELSFAQAGAGISPDPIAGSWSATIQNDDGVFHPRHPTSEFVDLLHVGRKIRLSVGGLYNGVAKYWPRMVGYMDAPKFQAATKSISLSGGDSMKALADTLLRSPNNYWGASSTLSSVETTKTFGSELYEGYTSLSTSNEADDVSNWTSVINGWFTSVAEAGGGSVYVWQFEKDVTDTYAVIFEPTVGSINNGKLYEVSFAYKKLLGAGSSLRFALYSISVPEKIVFQAEGLSTTAWTTVKAHFTAPYSCNICARFWIDGVLGVNAIYQIDQLTFREVTARVNTRYVMPAACNGPYYVTLDGAPLWYGDNNAGWLYDEANKTFYFDDNVWVETGTSNLVVYYFTTQNLIDVLGDVLMASGLYTSRIEALAASSYIDPAITVPRVWFEAGTSCLEAVRKTCERSNYRFWFDELDVPHFLPAPTHGDAVAWFSTKTCSDAGDFQELEEVRNRIVIEGIEQGAFSTAKDKKTSRMVCAATSDAASIAANLEKTHTITNDLFQDQAAMDAMAATLLAAFKDPKLYSDLRIPKNPIPLERGDTIEWDIELRPPTTQGGADGLKNTVRGIIRDASFSGDGFNYKCELRSTAMNIANYATGPVTVTAEHCKGWTLTNAAATGDVQFNLPASVVGMEITFYVMAAQTLTINPNGTERIAVVTGTAGDYLRSDNVIGSYIRLACLVAGYWHKQDIAGTFTEE